MVVERGDLGGVEVDLGRLAGLLGLSPPESADAPLVAGLQPGEVVLGGRGDEVVALGEGVVQELEGKIIRGCATYSEVVKKLE